MISRRNLLMTTISATFLSGCISNLSSNEEPTGSTPTSTLSIQESKSTRSPTSDNSFDVDKEINLDNNSISIDMVRYQDSIVTNQSADTLGVIGNDYNYLLVYISPGSSTDESSTISAKFDTNYETEPERMAIWINGEEHTNYLTNKTYGWLIFPVPDNSVPDQLTISFKTSTDETDFDVSLEKLGEVSDSASFAIHSFTLSDIPETSSLRVEVTIENRSEFGGIFRGAINIIGPSAAPVTSFERPIDGRNTATWSEEISVNTCCPGTHQFQLNWLGESLTEEISV